MRHADAIKHIISNGGRILNTVSMNFVDQAFLNGEEMLDEILAGSPIATARVYRPGCQETKEVGVTHKRTLNLSSSMGDLLYKVEPAVMSRYSSSLTL
jgi:hypothetical protein